jgi:hypothetical protein
MGIIMGVQGGIVMGTEIIMGNYNVEGNYNGSTGGGMDIIIHRSCYKL